MIAMDRSAESAFLADLLTASREGRVAWTGTVVPECYQVAVGSYLLIARPGEGQAPSLSLHHRTGHFIEVLSAEPECEDTSTSAVITEIYALARARALGFRRIWRTLSKQLAGGLAAPLDIDR